MWRVVVNADGNVAAVGRDRGQRGRYGQDVASLGVWAEERFAECPTGLLRYANGQLLPRTAEDIADNPAGDKRQQLANAVEAVKQRAQADILQVASATEQRNVALDAIVLIRDVLTTSGIVMTPEHKLRYDKLVKVAETISAIRKRANKAATALVADAGQNKEKPVVTSDK